VRAEAVQDPAPAIQARADGSVGGFVDLHPVMGSFSLLLRAPLVATSDRARRRPSARLPARRVVCFVPALIVGGWLARETRARGRASLEATAFGVLASTEDMMEGVSAMFSKRKPEFKGR